MVSIERVNIQIDLVHGIKRTVQEKSSIIVMAYGNKAITQSAPVKSAEVFTLAYVSVVHYSHMSKFSMLNFIQIIGIIKEIYFVS